MKKIISLLLCASMLFTLCACGAKKSTGEKVVSQIYEDNGLFTDVTLGKVENPIDLNAIRAGVTYVPQMFYGRYANKESYYKIGGVEEGIEFSTVEDGEILLSKLPVGIAAGPTTIYDDISFCDEYDIMQLRYITEDSNMDLFAAYEVEGKTLKLTFVKNYEFDPYTLNVKVKLTDTTVTYGFSFEGDTITLTSGDESVVLQNDLLGETPSFVEGYMDDDSPDRMGNIEFIDFGVIGGVIVANKEATESKVMLTAEHSNAACEYSTDGRFTLTYEDPDTKEIITNQYLAFICGYDGLILCDGLHTYCFTKSYNQVAIEELKGNLAPEQIAVLKELDDFELSELVETRNKLFADLESALDDQGVKATINRENGEIALDSNVLFAVGDSTLSSEGNAILAKFAKAYVSVVTKEEYKEFISQVMVEGHTDSTGDDASNKVLSQARADSVLDFCLSDGSGLNASQINLIKGLMDTCGYASERPVFNADGTENMDASRRVGFRFLVNVDVSEIEATEE